jgi:hypothetical protein
MMYPLLSLDGFAAHNATANMPARPPRARRHIIGTSALTNACVLNNPTAAAAPDDEAVDGPFSDINDVDALACCWIEISWDVNCVWASNSLVAQQLSRVRFVIVEESICVVDGLLVS